MSTADRVAAMTFGSIYPHYLSKAERKNQPAEKIDEVISWLTGYTPEELHRLAQQNTVTLRGFFADAPALNPHASLITGVICGYRVEDIEDPFMQRVRWMDKLVDEVARGKKMETIKRTA